MSFLFEKAKAPAATCCGAVLDVCVTKPGGRSVAGSKGLIEVCLDVQTQLLLVCTNKCFHASSLGAYTLDRRWENFAVKVTGNY